MGNGQTLTNSNNTILGTGIIGNGSLALINQGLIDATPEGGTTSLTLDGWAGLPIQARWKPRAAAPW